MTTYNTTFSRAICCPGCGLAFTPVSTTLRTVTKKQRAILDYLRAYIGEQGYAPSFDEIAAHFGYTSLATVHEHLTNLERKGRIVRAYNETRAIVLVEDATP